jgi:hypothetical protein
MQGLEFLLRHQSKDTGPQSRPVFLLRFIAGTHAIETNLL